MRSATFSPLRTERQNTACSHSYDLPLLNLCKAIVAFALWAVAQSATAHQLAVVTEPDNNSVSVFCSRSFRRVAQIPVGLAPRPLAVNRAGTMIFVGNSGSTSLIDVSTLSVVDEMSGPSTPWALLASDDGSKLFSADLLANTVTVTDLLTRAVITTVSVGRGPVAAVFTADGQSLLVATLDDGEVVFLDAHSYAITRRVKVGHAPLSIAVDGDRAYIANAGDGTVSVLDTGAGVVTHVLPVDLAISPPYINATAAIQVVPTQGGRRGFIAQTADYGEQSVFALVSMNLVSGAIQRTTPSGEHTPQGRLLDAVLSQDGTSLIVIADAFGFGNLAGFLKRFNTSSLEQSDSVILDHLPGDLLLVSDNVPAPGSGCQVGSPTPVTGPLKDSLLFAHCLALCTLLVRYKPGGHGE